ncbi:polysaccharide pyruvyl transferase WcaK-like protein [Streptomyces sp. Amel2xB2]|uniref:polysaccharide pyruvyl transferase family protein n=1 Tax=Streptomyces sp. Amel2xB2 TaxID=1305829 RepID=UPI000DB9E1DA|nr:polysaccharide pyruvyl transferase family protein [Streptomyces sp. Amel2xB2]RAJ59047.1 polysaccharide pyruvyl transferase WcaK-like protein [Streptomyces sp. Amel2xB2]
MRVLLIGDIGWRDLYHLGDEAMTEVALDSLQARGVTDVTLVGGHPDCASARYGVPSIARIGFRGTPDRSHNAARYEAVVDAARSGRRTLPDDDPAIAVIEAVRTSDAVLVAGGGNLNSFFPQHIFERASLAAVAAVLGKPFALTSQTIGPLIRRQDEPYLRSLLGPAVGIGARERHTLASAHAFGAGEGRAASTMDDAFGLLPRAEDRASVARYQDEPYIVASFAENPSTPSITKDGYYRLAAKTLVELADLYRAKVLLVPHAGTFQEGRLVRDQVSNETIAALARDDRVQPTSMLTAREVAALTQDAALVVGTRYHPAIFAARTATPAVSLAPTMYSSVRMRGASANVGLEDYVLDLASWRSGLVLRAARELLDDDRAVRAHMTSVRETRIADHEAWWDALVPSMKDGQPITLGECLTPVDSYASPGTWATAARSLLDETERHDRQRMTLKWRIDELEREVRELRRASAENGGGRKGRRRTRLAKAVRARLRTVIRRLRSLRRAGRRQGD